MRSAPRRHRWRIALTTLALAVTARLGHFHWSRLPATLDGFGYAAHARGVLAGGHFPAEGFRADNFVFTALVAVWSEVLGGDPLYLIQPLAVAVGAASCLVGVALVGRVGREWGWPARRVALAAGTVGVLLAVEGLYLRRTSIPDSDVVSFLFVPLLALGFHWYLRTGRRAWGGVALLLAAVYPLTHTFSSFVAGLAVLAVLAGAVVRRFDRRTLLVGPLAVLGFWAYLAAYYAWAGSRGGMVVPYVDRVTTAPGLFVAWLVLLAVGTAWLRSTTRRLARAAFLLPVGFLFVVLAANAVLPVFPGTPTTPLPLLGLVAALAVPCVLAAGRFPAAARRPGAGAVLVALLAAPVVVVYFALTASLTPEYFSTALRAQSFAHLPVLALAALTAAALLVTPEGAWRPGRRPLRVGVLCLLVASAALTAPVAFVALDTLAVPATVPPSEYHAVGWTATHTAGWTSDDSTARIGNFLYRGGSVGPTRSWLHGGPPPDCPVLARRTWVARGGHFFPGAPAAIGADRYERWLRDRQKVYDSGGIHGVAVVAPRGSGSVGC
jgi:hypothetical protein